MCVCARSTSGLPALLCLPVKKASSPCRVSPLGLQTTTTCPRPTPASLACTSPCTPPKPSSKASCCSPSRPKPLGLCRQQAASPASWVVLPVLLSCRCCCPVCAVLVPGVLVLLCNGFVPWTVRGVSPCQFEGGCGKQCCMDLLWITGV